MFILKLTQDKIFIKGDTIQSILTRHSDIIRYNQRFEKVSLIHSTIQLCLNKYYQSKLNYLYVKIENSIN